MDYQSFGWLPGQDLTILYNGRRMIDVNASFGNASVEIGGNSENNLDGQIIQGYEDNQHFLGTFGLYDGVADVPGHKNGSQGFLQSLYNHDIIPSRSWSYTAGTFNREPPVFGSMILGGYDQLRFDQSKTFASTITGQVNGSDLLVQIANITTDSPTSNKSLLQSPITAYLDTNTPYLWLPVQTCHLFEAAFGLVYNSSGNRYSVNGSLHDSLLALKANVTFRLMETVTNTSKQATVDIVMPYSSFDLEDKGTESVDNIRYFPLMRAESELQYTLGRAFFQDAYVIVDYENTTMQIHQAKYPSGSNPTDEGITSPIAIGVRWANSSPLHKRLAAKYIISIVVGTIVIVGLLALCFFFWLKMRKQKSHLKARASAELDGTQHISLQLSGKMSDILTTELPAYGPVSELAQRGSLFKELAELPAKLPVSELENRSPELEGSLNHPGTKKT